MQKVFFLFAIIASCLLFTKCITQTNPDKIEITWGVNTNNYNDSNNFLSELCIINHSNVPLQNNWELFFNFSPCRTIDMNSLPDQIRIDHINGDFFRMYPSTSFKELESGDTLKIPIVASAWIIKESGAPGGFYFIFDKIDDVQVNAKFTLSPFNKPEQINRTSRDIIEIPNAENIFEKNKNLTILDKDHITKITPTPNKITLNNDIFILESTTPIYYQKDLESEAKFFQSKLSEDIGLDVELTNELPNTGNYISLKKQEDKSANEGYNLNITNDKILITGTDNAGVFYGIQSLRNLLPLEAYKKNQNSVSLQGLEVEDKPRFEYRGMHFDVARNFQSKESVLKLLNLMSFYKLNKLHFHLTDDEGWRVEINGLPELTDVGAVRGHTRDERDNIIHQYGSADSKTGTGYYSTDEFIEILKFATERHIEIIPEIDLPGHAHAAIKAMEARYFNYIEKGDTLKANEYLLSDFNDQSEYHSVQNFDDNVICVGRESTYTFIKKVVDELANMYEKAEAPFKTVHTGGDEVPVGAWLQSPVCQQLFPDDNPLDAQKLKSYFLDRFSEILNSRNLTTAGWEEIALHLEPIPGEEEQSVKTVNPAYLEKDFLPYTWNSVYGWGGEETAYKLANKGYKVVLCNVTHLYLDMAYNKNPNEPGFYWGGFVTTEHPYLFEPLNFYNSLKIDLDGNPIDRAELDSKTKLSKTGKDNIVGMQGHLWSETIKSPERIDYMIFPRLISLAERAWGEQPEWVEKRELYQSSWNEFANRLGQRENVRLSYLHGGVKFRIPRPGAKVINGNLHANTALPGMVIRYTTDGNLPTQESSLYIEPIELTGTITLCTFDNNGRKSLPTKIILD